jgi:glycosyltransferase involved in cell wall biosynthesis
MIHIGVYLASEPYGGGTYQYNLSVIHALESFDKSEYKITSFFHDEEWIKILPKEFNKVTTGRPLILRALGKIYKIIDRTPESLRRFASIFNPMVKKINNSDCDIVVYPSQDAASYQTNKKSLSTIHDLMHRYESHFEEYQNGEYDRREKHYSMMSKYANGILVDSKIGKQHVVESYGTDEKKVFVLPFVPPLYLLDAKDIDVKTKYNLPDKYIFYPAQFWEHKNHINLLEAIKILKDQGLDVNLVLVGSKKSHYEKVLKKIDELKLSNNIFILGYVSNTDIASLYTNAVATTFVSLIGPTNIPPMEALTLGCPLICSNAYAMPEQVGDAALFVDPKCPQDIAEKIRKIYLDEDLAKNYIQVGYKRIEDYGQTEFTIKLEGYIKEVLFATV